MKHLTKQMNSVRNVRGIRMQSNIIVYRKCLACGRVGVRIPAATDLSRKRGSDSSTAKRSAAGVRVTGLRR